MRIDLHNHSKYSDGLYSVKNLIEIAKKQKVDVLALTDHDSVFGVDEAYEIGAQYGIKVLKGMELSTFYKGNTVHIVALFKHNIVPKELYDFSQNIIDIRNNRCIKMMENIRNIYKVKTDMDYLFKDATIITRANMYQCLIHSNPNLTHEEAHQMVSDKSPAYIPSTKLDTVSGLKMLRELDSIAILAHPTLIKRDIVEEIVKLGFDGIEARYPLNKENDFEYFADLAKKYNMFISAGSDFHGDDRHAMIGTSVLNEAEFKIILNKLELGDDF